MHIACLLPSQLTASQRATWQTLRAGGTGLDNPFFAVEFFELLESLRGGVEILVLSEHGAPVAFLPLERCGHVAHTAGSRVAEIQGPVAPAGFAWNPTSVMQSLGLSIWRYGCVPIDQTALAPHHLCERRFPCVDLEAGLEAYLQSRRAAGSKQIEQTRRKVRKFARERAPLHFVWHTDAADALARLIEWKSDQYQRTGTLDLFRFDWVCALARRATMLTNPNFSGVLSVLYCGDRPVAAHLGLRSNGVLCWWLPAYDRRFSQYSPGSILLLEVIEAAAAHGIARIDLGQGDERYKQSFANADFAVAEGAVSLHAWNRTARRTWIHMREWAQSTPACAAPLRMFRSVRNRLIHP